MRFQALDQTGVSVQEIVVPLRGTEGPQGL